MLKIFKDNLKTSPNNNSIGVSVEFSKFLGGREEASCASMTTVTFCFDDVIACVIMSALKKVYK